MIFIFFNTISKKRRFDFRFNVDFATNFFIFNSIEKIIDLSILFIWMKNKNVEIMLKKIEKNEKIKSR